MIQKISLIIFFVSVAVSAFAQRDITERPLIGGPDTGEPDELKEHDHEKKKYSVNYP